MKIDCDSDPSYSTVTFTWTETNPDRPAVDVLVRLLTLADNAYEDGELEPYLLDRDSGVWRTTVTLPSDFRSYHGHDYACWRGGLADGLIALLNDSR